MSKTRFLLLGLSLVALLGAFKLLILRGSGTTEVVLVQGAGSMVPIDLDQSASEIVRIIEPEILPLFSNQAEENGALGQILLARMGVEESRSAHSQGESTTVVRPIAPLVLFKVGDANYEISILKNGAYEPMHERILGSPEDCVAWLAAHIKSAQQAAAGQPATTLRVGD